MFKKFLIALSIFHQHFLCSSLMGLLLKSDASLDNGGVWIEEAKSLKKIDITPPDSHWIRHVPTQTKYSISNLASPLTELSIRYRALKNGFDDLISNYKMLPRNQYFPSSFCLAVWRVLHREVNGDGYACLFVKWVRAILKGMVGEGQHPPLSQMSQF